MIDLSKAKLFDSFRTFNGDVLQLTAIMPERDSIWKYILSNDKTYDTYTVNGEITPGLRSGKDLEGQIHVAAMKDKAITDKILKDVEKVTNGVAEAMPLIESAAIANLPRESLLENNEDDAELQRRQEVVELADRIFFSERGSAYSFKECIEVAEYSVNVTKQYLKEGKL